MKETDIFKGLIKEQWPKSPVPLRAFCISKAMESMGVVIPWVSESGNRQFELIMERARIIYKFCYKKR